MVGEAQQGATIPTSAIGDAGELALASVLLPGFVKKGGDGLYLDLTALDSSALLMRFVERVFATPAYFVDLDYPLFLRLLFQTSSTDIAAWIDRLVGESREPMVRWCADIAPFPPERQGLYRGLKVAADGATAEYFFEQISIDHASETGADGATTSERIYLNRDEFVAALWLKGVRFGIDMSQVVAMIDADRVDRLAVAHTLAPVAGQDASIAEHADELHRNDAPRLMSNGKVDLRKFHNRFPQVREGSLLVRKLPRVEGVSGWDVRGKELLPERCKDFNLADLAGAGTRVAHDAKGEYLVALMDGFVSIDTKSSVFSVSEKIVNRDGVSLRTTGDLSLAGKEFEEHGEVQERRLVEGHHMTFCANVFGDIVSSGGRVVLKQNLAGGSAKSSGGSVLIEGNASRASVTALHGSVAIARAESCMIVGQTVRIGRATACDIVADEVHIEQAEACAIAAREIVIVESAALKSSGTIIHLLMPDVERYERAINELLEHNVLAEKAKAAQQETLSALVGESEFKAYLAIESQTKSGKLSLSPAQERNLQTLKARLAPQLKEYVRLREAVAKLTQDQVAIQSRIEAMQKERNEALAAVACRIEKMRGETLVRRRPSSGSPSLATLGTKELHVALRDAGQVADRMLFAETGSFSWPEAIPARNS